MKLLFITTRSPLSLVEQDGGAIFASQILRYIAPRCELDVLFLRTPDLNHLQLPNVNAIHFITPDFQIGNRFQRRIESARLVKEWLIVRYQVYDAILVQHVSSGFGINDIPYLANKMILFPMFTGIAYQRSGEVISSVYLNAEEQVLKSAPLVICPSQAEAADIISGYHVDERNISFVPFGIDLNNFKFIPRHLQLQLCELIYVATIKKQKNQIDCLSILERLLQRNRQAKIHLVGGIGDQVYFTELMSEISHRNLDSHVVYHGVLSSEEIAKIASHCSFAISTTYWETFGISIFESLAMGLPVIVYDDVPCFWEYLHRNVACMCVSRRPNEIADRIITFYEQPEDYEWRSAQSRAEVSCLDERFVLQTLFEKINLFVNEPEGENR